MDPISTQFIPVTSSHPTVNVPFMFLQFRLAFLTLRFSSDSDRIVRTSSRPRLSQRFVQPCYGRALLTPCHKAVGWRSVAGLCAHTVCSHGFAAHLCDPVFGPFLTLVVGRGEQISCCCSKLDVNTNDILKAARELLENRR